jgi:zinc protease
VIGTEATVTALTTQDLHSYYRAHYGPDNTCLVAAGDFNSAEMLKMITDLFGKQIPSKRPSGPDFTNRNGHVQHKVIHKNVRMAHFALGIRVPGMASPDMIALDVLSDVLGGGASCRFYQHLRERDRVALSISCDYIPFVHDGLFSIFGETQPANAEKARLAAKAELAAIEKDPITAAEIQRAQARLKSEWLHAAETPRGQASTLGSLAVFNRLDLVENYLADVDKLTPAKLMDVYDRYLKGKELSTILLLPQP